MHVSMIFSYIINDSEGGMNMKRKVNKFIYWTPRVLSILFIIFLALMSLDVFSPGATAGEIIIGLLMHNIPALILLTVLIISWKYEYEIVGGVVFLLAGILYIVLAVRSDIPWIMALVWSLQIAGPAFLVGILFMVNWFKRKQ